MHLNLRLLAIWLLAIKTNTTEQVSLFSWSVAKKKNTQELKLANAREGSQETGEAHKPI